MTIGVGDKRTTLTPQPAGAAQPASTTATTAAPQAAATSATQAPNRLNQDAGAFQPVAAREAAPAEAAKTYAVPTDTYNVKKGDTLGKIARDHANDLQTVVKDNKIANPNAIEIGQKIKLRDTVLLTVEKGDTLKGLAAQYGVAEKELASANGLKPGAAISAGQQLKLPGAVFYTVKAGDTLAGIAKTHGTTVQAIATANEISNVNLIRIDQRLVVPGKGKPAPVDPLAAAKKDPAVMNIHKGEAKYQHISGGQLYVNGVSPNDVRQGEAGDCYFLASISSLAHAKPEMIQKLIKDNGNGTFTVTFHESTWEAKNPKDPNSEWVEKFKPVTVQIDADVAQSYNSPVYAKGGTDKELWAPLLEKAYAKWKGGFEAIGNGGWSEHALQELTGKPSEAIYMYEGEPKDLVQQLKNRTSTGVPVTASTKADEEVSGGIIGNHAYTVLGVVEKEGKTFIQLRNPWGYAEFGNDGKDDGTFLIPAAKFRQNFSAVQFGLA